MPELTIEELSALFAWIVDAQAFLPLSDAAKSTVDKLIAYQQVLKQIDVQWEKKKNQSPAECDPTLTNEQEVARFWAGHKETTED